MRIAHPMQCLRHVSWAGGGLPVTAVAAPAKTGSASGVAWLLAGLAAISVFAISVMTWRIVRARASSARSRAQYASRALGPHTIGGLGREGEVHPLPSAPVRVEPPHTVRTQPRVTRPDEAAREAFLGEASATLLALHAAWREMRRDDIARLTVAPIHDAMLAHFDADTDSPRSTAVEGLTAEFVLRSASTVDGMASVRFRGVLCEPGADGEMLRQAFDEVWSFERGDDTMWRVAHVQRVESLE